MNPYIHRLSITYQEEKLSIVIKFTDNTFWQCARDYVNVFLVQKPLIASTAIVTNKILTLHLCSKIKFVVINETENLRSISVSALTEYMREFIDAIADLSISSFQSSVSLGNILLRVCKYCFMRCRSRITRN